MKDDNKEMDTKVQSWLNEISEAKKREKDFRDNGKKILDIYNCEDSKKTPFNILFSNTETMLPALFSNTPRPIVKRRFSTEESPLVTAGAKAATRLLEYQLDTNVDGYARFDTTMVSVVVDALLPGRGHSCIKYDAKISGDEDSEKVDFETVCLDSKKWDEVIYGYSKKWETVPWIAYADQIDEDEAESLFGEDISNKIIFTKGEDQEDEESSNDEVKHIGERKTALIYKIWDKTDKNIKYISPQYKDGYLREDKDEFGITGFFDCPRPLQFIEKSNDLLPTALYMQYEQQAMELNDIQKRLTRVIKAIKVRGAYDGNLGDELSSIMEEEDNGFTPTDKSTLLEGGLEKHIWMLPIEKLITVAQQLYLARESCKKVIQEISGISDILRGQSAASETLGAQKLKETWGTMRIKRLQKRVQEYARDSLRIMLDISVNKLSVTTWAKITGLPYPMEDAREKAREEYKLREQEHQQKAQQAQSQGVPPDQIPPFKAPPELEEIVNSVSWEEILEFLKDDYIRSYKVDIETNSTLEAEATEDKQLVAEFMNAMAQFMNGIMPMVQTGILPFGAMKSMLIQISRRFRFGDDVEDQLNDMQEPKPQADPKMEEAQKKLQEAQKQIQAENQKIEQAKQQFEQEMQKAGKRLDDEFNKLEAEKMQFDFDKRLANEQLKNTDKINQIRLDADQKAAEEEIKSLLKESERKTQSMLDKHANMVKSYTDSQKSTHKTIIKDETGEITEEVTNG